MSKNQAPSVDNPKDQTAGPAPGEATDQTKRDTGNDPRNEQSLFDYLGNSGAGQQQAEGNRADTTDESATSTPESGQPDTQSESASSQPEPDTEPDATKDTTQTQQGSEDKGEEGDVEGLLPDKFKEDPERFVKSYNELQNKLSDQGQELGELRRQYRQVRTYLRRLRQQRQQQPQQQQTQQAQQQQQEEDEQSGQDTSNFWRDPERSIEEKMEQKVRDLRQEIQKEVEPVKRTVQQQQEIERRQRQIDEARQRYPDFDDMRPHIKEQLQQQGEALLGFDNMFEAAYKLAKAEQATTSQADTQTSTNQQQQPDTQQEPDTSSAQQQNTVAEDELDRLLEDPEVEQRLLERLSLRQNQQDAPQVIGDQSSQAPAAPPEEIKSTKDAAQASRNFFERLVNPRPE